MWSAAGVSCRIFAVGICFVLNMLDGMDILMMSYLAPAIAKIGTSARLRWASSLAQRLRV